jgi:hypothetical protein
MNHRVLIALCFIIAILACNKDKSEVAPKSNSTTTTSQPTHHYAGKGDDSAAFSSYITVDVANKMINSYLYSISTDSTNQAPDLNSLIINADSLRAYLANPQITSIKLIFAHTMDYINAGNYGINAGYQSGALTMIIAAYDANGNYVYFAEQGVQGTQYVLDHAQPCPYNCPQGTAGSSLLQ